LLYKCHTWLFYLFIYLFIYRTKNKNGRIGNNRGNSGRKRVIDQDTREEIIDKVLKNRWTTALDLFNDEKLNLNGVSVDTIETMFIEELFYAYRQVVIPLVSEPNK
jgi:hypothetical protein